MSDLKRDAFVSLPLRRAARSRQPGLTVETIVFAAQRLAGQRLDADVVVLETADALMPFMDAMAELAAAASDSNPLFEPPTLRAAMQFLDERSKARVALVWSKPKADGARQLIGLFPYNVRRFYLGLPVAIWSIWTHVHTFNATPLLRAGHEHDALRRFMQFADQSGARLMRFPLFQSDGAFGPALAEVLGERGLATAETGRHERAFLKADMAGDAYLAMHMRKKKRKEYNRLWNRLAEMGDLRFEAQGNDVDIAPWVRDFLALERSGWKGKRGTALAERPNETAFFESMCAAARAQDKFLGVRITLDGRPIAMLASFVAGRGAYSFKIAHDENYARFSPGALLMMKVIDAYHADPRVDWADSCAIPNHPMIDHIWAERRAMREVNAATRHPASRWLVAYSARMTRIADRVWAALRQAYHRLRKEVERD